MSITDPYLQFGYRITFQAFRSVRKESWQNLLAVAFSPVIHQCMDLVFGNGADDTLLNFFDKLNTAKEEVSTPMHVIITEDTGLAIQLSRKYPGPIFDLRPETNGYGTQLLDLAYYVPLNPMDELDWLILPRVLAMLRQWHHSVIYVLGNQTYPAWNLVEHALALTRLPTAEQKQLEVAWNGIYND